jgi:hypothetical protein
LLRWPTGEMWLAGQPTLQGAEQTDFATDPPVLTAWKRSMGTGRLDDLAGDDETRAAGSAGCDDRQTWLYAIKRGSGLAVSRYGEFAT